MRAYFDKDALMAQYHAPFDENTLKMVDVYLKKFKGHAIEPKEKHLVLKVIDQLHQSSA